MPRRCMSREKKPHPSLGEGMGRKIVCLAAVRYGVVSSAMIASATGNCRVGIRTSSPADRS